MNFPPQSPREVPSLCAIPPQQRRRQRQVQSKQPTNRIAPTRSTSSWFTTPVGHILLFQVLFAVVLSPLYSPNNAIVGLADAQTTTSSSSSSNCRMDIWVYSTMDICQNMQPPTSTGILYADGKCRNTKDSSDTSTSLLPGTYRAACTADRKKIRFLDSGCTNTDNTCSSNGVVTTIGNYTRNICPQDTSIPSSLYSRLEVPEFNVQNTANATTAGFFACDKLTGKSSSTGNTIQVTFVVFGDCSDPSCSIYDDSFDNNTAPVNSQPSPAPSTFTSTTTDVPTEGTRTTFDPTMNTYEPTATVVVDNPTKSPTTDEPSEEVTTLSPTGSPENSPTIAPSQPVRVETISAGMVLSEVDGSISTTAVNVWENITTTHLYETAQSEGFDVLKIVTKQIQQEQLNEDSEIVKVVSVVTIPPQHPSNHSSLIVRSRSRHRAHTRRVQASTNWLDRSVRIFFDVTMTFPSSTPDNVTTERIFQDAFDTEAERTRYIIQIVNSKTEGLTTTFENVTRIQILNTDNTTIEVPTAAPITNGGASPTSTNPTNNNTPGSPSAPNVESPVVDTISASGGSGSSTYIIAGAAVGVTLLLVACGYLVYNRGKKDALNRHIASGDGKGGVGSQTSASSPATEEPRWTNEIIIDPTADDVSTLGGSVLMLGLGSSGMTRNPADEPTASVNHDFDYAKNRYRSGALHEDATIDDGNNTRVTNPTQVTSFSKLGNHLDCYAEEDDNSFEQLYQEPRSDDEETIEKMKTYLTPPPSAFSPPVIATATPPRASVISTPGVSTTIYPVAGSNSEQRDSTAAVVVTTFRQPSPARSASSGGGTARALPPPPASPGRRFDTTVAATSPVRTAASSRLLTNPAPVFGVGASPARSSSSSRLQYHDPVLIVPAGTSPVRSASTSRLQQAAQLPPSGPTRFQIRAPPGLLGMVLDTPGGRRPVVRAIKENSVLAPDVMVGDYLVEVDCIDTTELSAMEVSNIISTKAHLYRRLVFVRE